MALEFNLDSSQTPPFTKVMCTCSLRPLNLFVSLNCNNYSPS